MIKNVWVYGMGGVGGHFGGRLSRAAYKGVSPVNVFFIARGSHLDAIRAKGLRIVWPGGREEICTPAMATDNAADLPAPDLCLLCVKSFDLEDACRDIAAAAKNDTIVMPLLNGVSICGRVRKIVDRGYVLPSCVFVVALKTADGTVACQGGEGVLFSGRDPRCPELDFPQVRDFFATSGLDLRWQDSAAPLIWKKYTFIASFGLVTAAFEKTFGQVMAEPESKGLVVGIMQEIKALAEKEGVAIDSDVVDWALLNASKLPFATTTSFQRDVVSGERAEDDIFTSDLIELGRKHNLEMPVTKSVIAALGRVRAGA